MNREQFISHVEGSQKWVRRFLSALCCGDSATADDIAQETFIKAYLSIDNLNDDACFQAWIHKIAYNTFVNHNRARRNTSDYNEAIDLATPERSDDAFRYQELYMALGRLSEKERTSVLLYYLEGYSIKEISEISGSTQSAVKQHLSRGREHLRLIMDKK